MWTSQGCGPVRLGRRLRLRRQPPGSWQLWNGGDQRGVSIKEMPVALQDRLGDLERCPGDVAFDDCLLMLGKLALARRLLHFLECQVPAHAIFHGLALSLIGHDENEVVAISPWVEVGSLLLEDLGDLLRKPLGFGANSQCLVPHNYQGWPAVPDLVGNLVGSSREGDHVELAACLTEDLADPL